jgi:hypothetical protein
MRKSFFCQKSVKNYRIILDSQKHKKYNDFGAMNQYLQKNTWMMDAGELAFYATPKE